MENNHGREKWLSKLFRILNSAFCFASAYLFIHYLHWVIVALMGTRYRLNAFLYFHGVKFLMNGNRWDREMVVLTYAVAPLVAMVIGLLAVFLFSKTKKFKTILNVFLLWLYVAGVGFFLSQAIISSIGVSSTTPPFYNDWAVVFAWVGIPAVIVYALNIPFVIVMLYFGANAARPFMLLAYTYTKFIKLDRRRKYFAEVAILPFILGALIVLCVGFPTSPTAFAENFIIHGVYLLVIGIMLIAAWIALSYINVQREDLLRYKTLQEMNVFALFTLVILIVFIKLTWGGIYV